MDHNATMMPNLSADQTITNGATMKTPGIVVEEPPIVVNGRVFHEVEAAEATPPLTRAPSPSALDRSMPFSRFVSQAQRTLSGLRKGQPVTLDGHSLDVASLVAVANYPVTVELDDKSNLQEKIDASVKSLAARLKGGELVYGVNTGFGGSADTRTTEVVSLQRALIQHQNSGILTSRDIGIHSYSSASNMSDIGTTSMPTPWVRGLMLSRVNSLLRGHSAVSLPIVQSILTLINLELTPVIPMRGSISASGDLMPLSYVAAVLQGNPSMYVRTTAAHRHAIISAPEALRLAGLEPIALAAKEGLGLLNGTAASVSVASLSLHEATSMAMLSQALTAMSVEALNGTAESFHPFISSARPHRGQEHAAANILSFLQGSKLAHGLVVCEIDRHVTGLCQDRYPLRTSPQWIGPLLEDLELAHQQVTVELNSTTDNPIIDHNGAIHHGGNFQAASMTSALEKTRNALQHLGQMLFAQSTEIVNPAMNRGLPPNLCADDPSLSFTCKGLDINMAAYASELGWLNHPLGPHVKSAEMHNQGLNSLALIAGRATQNAVEVFSMMCAAHLFLVCQALDLRVLLTRFLAHVEPELSELTRAFLRDAGASGVDTKTLIELAATKFRETWNSTTTSDLADRCSITAGSIIGSLVNALSAELIRQPAVRCSLDLAAWSTYRRLISVLLHTAYVNLRSEMFRDHLVITPQYLGRASTALYTSVRKDLGVPFFRGLVEDPTDTSSVTDYPNRDRKSIGTWTSVIYEALRAGQVTDSLVKVM